MKIFDTNINITYVEFEADNKKYGMSIEIDCLGNMKNLMFSTLYEDGTIETSLKSVKIISIVPKNKLAKIKEIALIIKHRINYCLKKLFHNQ